VKGAVDRHRRVDALEVGVVARQIEPLIKLDQRKSVRLVAVDLVRGNEDEGRVGRVVTSRLE
jgi:hypothetical protein